MSESGPPRTPPSATDGAGVRVIPTRRSARWSVVLYLLAAVAAIAAGFGYLLYTPAPSSGSTADRPARAAPADSRALAAAAARVDITRTRRVAAPVVELPEEPYELPSLDPDDIAAHFLPGDPEPTGAELIEALNHAGIHRGIGAFNPPGTSPPLQGVVVPEDFELPEGYVRHYQVTDEGEPIEAILLFSPDFEFFDADGRPIAIPDDRVVPPEWVPPGMPIERVHIPQP